MPRLEEHRADDDGRLATAPRPQQHRHPALRVVNLQHRPPATRRRALQPTEDLRVGEPRRPAPRARSRERLERDRLRPVEQDLVGAVQLLGDDDAVDRLGELHHVDADVLDEEGQRARLALVQHAQAGLRQPCRQRVAHELALPRGVQTDDNAVELPISVQQRLECPLGIELDVQPLLGVVAQEREEVVRRLEQHLRLVLDERDLVAGNGSSRAQPPPCAAIRADPRRELSSSCAWCERSPRHVPWEPPRPRSPLRRHTPLWRAPGGERTLSRWTPRFPSSWMPGILTRHTWGDSGVCRPRCWLGTDVTRGGESLSSSA